MGLRLDLHALLKTIVDNVYFQPPNNLTMTYPCIRYELDDVEMLHASNLPYTKELRYQLTVIDRDPDSVILNELTKLPKCRFGRFYTADNLNHFVFNLYY